MLLNIEKSGEQEWLLNTDPVLYAIVVSMPFLNKRQLTSYDAMMVPILAWTSRPAFTNHLSSVL